MSKINPPKKVKPFVGLLLSELSLLEKCKKALELSFGPSDIQSHIIPFSHSDYYDAEMGNKISRLWISFSQLQDPGNLADWKINSNTLEDIWAINSTGKKLRQINIDPGYLSEAKIVLASTKNFSHRIYLGSGIYAEVTMQGNNSSRHIILFTAILIYKWQGEVGKMFAEAIYSGFL